MDYKSTELLGQIKCKIKGFIWWTGIAAVSWHWENTEKTSGRELVYLNCRTNHGMFFCHVFLRNLHFLCFFYLELGRWEGSVQCISSCEVLILWCWNRTWHGLCFCWTDPSKRNLFPKNFSSLKKAHILYLSGIWWQGPLMAWWHFQIGPCSNSCLSPSFSKRMCDISQ